MATADVQTATPSHMRTVPGSVNIHVTNFPKAASGDTGVDAAQIASAIINSFNKALDNKDFALLSRLFVDDGYWRDHLAVTWRFRTIRTSPSILDFLQVSAKSKDGFRLSKIAVDDSSVTRAPKVASLDAAGQVPCVRLFIGLTTVVGRGTGLIKLVQAGGEWKIFSLYTRLEELTGHEEAVNERRGKGVAHGGQPGRKNWAERRQADADFTATEPAVLVVGTYTQTLHGDVSDCFPGAGQAGLTAASRLKMLGVDTLVVDQNERVGDNWRKRYHQLVLHDPVWYDHMPYMPFPSQWPIFTPKDKLADFFESYATLLELNVWTRTELVYTRYNELTKNWTVVLNRKNADGTSTVRVFHPRHVIQATGHSGKKNQPTLKGADNFKGDRFCHSSEFPGATENSQGKKAVVVGSCNSAHDICQDFLEKGYDVTIVQRSTTHVVSSRAITDIGLKGLFEEGGPPVDDADMLIHGLPSSVLKAIQVTVCAAQAEADKEILAGLDKVGFKVDRGPDGAGLFLKYFQRGGGYYIDVGASRLIADGKIKVKQGQEIKEILPRGIRFADGTELEADEIVLATGYQNMRTQTRSMFGDAVADKVGDVWGFNEEGEMRTIWQRSGHPGFWFHGGNLALCRFYSKNLALQIKGLEEGLYEDGDI